MTDENKPLYLGEVQRRLMSANESDTYRLIFRVMLPDGSIRELSYLFPADELLAKDFGLYSRYLQALANNILTTFAGTKLQIFYRKSSSLQRSLFERMDLVFEIENKHRTSFGSIVNYTDRINRHFGCGRFSFRFFDESEYEEISAPVYRLCDDADLCAITSAVNLPHDRKWISLDIGGNSIKGVLLAGKKPVVMKEHRWTPSIMKTAAEFNGDVVAVVRFLICYYLLLQSDGDDDLHRFLSPDIPVSDFFEAFDGKLAAPDTYQFADAMIVGYPDIIIDSKVVGGETYKHLGIRNHFGADYHGEYLKLYDLDLILQDYVKPGGSVLILNDGNVASLVESLERTIGDASCYADPTFVHTIGTEMGTGVLAAAMCFQRIPLECYQYIIDLGSGRFAAYDSDDVRSINNVNTSIPGTIQKYVSQMGLFRLAIRNLEVSEPDKIIELLEEGLLSYDQKKDRLIVPTSPEDRRSELTFKLVGWLEEGNKAVGEAYAEMGRVLAELILQVQIILPEVSLNRVVCGGVIYNDSAYDAFRRGLESGGKELSISRLGENYQNLKLLQDIKPEDLSFQVAIGAFYVLNYYLTTKQNKKKESEGEHGQ